MQSVGVAEGGSFGLCGLQSEGVEKCWVSGVWGSIVWVMQCWGSGVWTSWGAGVEAYVGDTESGGCLVGGVCMRGVCGTWDRICGGG